MGMTEGWDNSTVEGTHTCLHVDVSKGISIVGNREHYKNMVLDDA